MIRLTVEESSSTFLSFVVEGHSSMGEKGNNLLCAGVSTLTQTIFLSIRDILKLNVVFSKQDGFLRCVLPDIMTDSDSQSSSLLIMTLINGFQDLKNQYPEEIDIVWRNIDSP